MARQINKNILTLILMASSICLLILLQVFWIISEYRNARQTFKRESNLVFKNAIHDFMASRFQEVIHLDSTGASLPVDPGEVRKIPGFPLHDDILPGAEFPGDTAHERPQMKVMVWRKACTPPETGDTAAVRNATGNGRSGRFMIRFDPDSLNTGLLSEKLAAQLRGIGRDLRFTVVKKAHGGMGADTAEYLTEFVKISPRYQYAASFEGVNRMLGKEIIPQIAFSAFLLLLTVGAFLILYRNLLRQQQLVRQKNEFISNVSHELKTPVATVSVALEALKNFKVLKNVQRTEEYLDLAQNELKRLSVMTERILDLAALGSRGMVFEEERLDLEALIRQVTDSMQLFWKKQQATVHLQVAGDDFVLAGHKVHLTGVIYNLLDNAVKFSSPPATVVLSLKEEGQWIRVVVRDEGPGIPGVYQKKIFEKFFRVPQDNVHTVKGYGLGLAYALQVIRAHKGRIAVKSDVGKGSSFSITLPKYGSNYGSN